MTKVVGFIGLGNIGGPMSLNLLKSGFEVIGFDLVEKRDFVSAGGRQVRTVQQVGGQADVIIQSLPSVEALENTVDALLEVARSGQVIIEISSYPPEDKKCQALRLARRSVTMLDCEISGLPAMVANRSAVIFQSGDRMTVDSVSGVFAAMTDTRIYLGEFGSATRMKLLANMMVAIHNSVAAEALHLASRVGIDSRDAIRALGPSAAGSVTFSMKAPVMISREFDAGVGPFRHMFGYLERISNLAGEAGASTPLLNLVRDYYRKAEAEERGDQDIAAIIEMLEAESGERARDQSED